MPKNPKDTIERLSKVVSAWETLRPAKSFGGLTLAQFKQAIAPCTTARAAIDQLEARQTEAIDQREKADLAAFSTLQLIVNGVRADAAEGENGELYEAMGYVRKSERASGLTRRKAAAATVPAAR